MQIVERREGARARGSIARVGLVGALALACARPAGSPTVAPATPEVTARLQDEAQALRQALATAEWARLTGSSAQEVTAHASLLEPETLAALAEGASRAEPEAQRELMALHAFLVRERLRRAMAPALSALSRAEAETMVRTGDVSIALALLPAWLEREPDRARREGVLHAGWLAERPLEPLRQAVVTAAQQAARELGFSDVASLLGHAWGYDAREAARLAGELVARSEALYLSALGDLAPPWLASSELTTQATLPHVRRAAELDAFFPPEAALTHVTATLSALGLDLAALTVQVEAASAAGRPSGGGCARLAANDVRLALTPSGGARDYEAAFGAAGCALAAALVPATPVSVDEPVVAAALGALLAGLVDDPAWLALQLGLSEPATTLVVRARAFARLTILRAHAEDTRNVEPVAPGALPLRAALIAASLERRLVERFGNAWWTRAEAGVFLRERLNEVGRRGVAALEADVLRVEPLLVRVARAFARSDVLAGASAAEAPR